MPGRTELHPEKCTLRSGTIPSIVLMHRWCMNWFVRSKLSLERSHGLSRALSPCSASWGLLGGAKLAMVSTVCNMSAFVPPRGL